MVYSSLKDLIRDHLTDRVRDELSERTSVSLRNQVCCEVELLVHACVWGQGFSPVWERVLEE